MAPGKGSRKRPLDASDSKKAHDKKRVKSDIPSNAESPAKSSVLKPKSTEDDSFPRGGASVLTPLEFKEIANKATEDVLFGGGKAEDGPERELKSKKKSKPNQATGTPKKRNADSRPDEGPKIEGLSYKRLSPGSWVLGCVSSISTTDIALSLPNNLTGYIPLTAISNQYSSILEKVLADQEQSDADDEMVERSSEEDETYIRLDRQYYVGQFLRAFVVSVEDSGKHSTSRQPRKRIELSIHPAQANEPLTLKELVVGSTVQASVSSIEDHGLIMDVGGVGSLSGFMPLKEIDDHFTRDDLKVGQVMLCTVLGVSNGKVVKLSARKPKDLKKAKGKSPPGYWLSEAPSVDCFMPGTPVEVLVTDVGRNGGFSGKIMGMLDAVADFVHSGGWNERDLTSKVKPGSMLKARVISTFSQSESRKVGVSILPHILALAGSDIPLAQFPIGKILKAAKVKKVEPTIGFIMDTGLGDLGGFVHISRISSEEKVESLSHSTGLYKEGSTHDARILGYNFMDRLLLLSTEKKVLEQPFLDIKDVVIGQVVPGVIERVIPGSGVLVNLAEGIKGFVEDLHLSDVKLKNPEKKFREGLKVKCRVLSVDAETRRIRLTMKKTLVNSDAPIVTSYDVAPGLRTIGTLVSVFTKGAVVKFFGDVKGFLPVSEMSEAFIKDPTEHFHVGQTVNVHVVSVDQHDSKMTVSCRDPGNYTESQKASFSKLPIGFIVEGMVTEKSDEDLMIDFEYDNTVLKGILTLGHLSEGGTDKGRLVLKRLRVGQKLKRVAVLSKFHARSLTELTLKPSLVEAAESGKLPSELQALVVGQRYKGTIRNITGAGILLVFGGELKGFIPNKYIPAEKLPLPQFGLEKFQVIEATVVNTDIVQQRCTLSLLPVTDLSPQKNKPSYDVVNPIDPSLQILEDIVEGKVLKAKISSIKETQINVHIADNVQGRIDITEVYDSWGDIRDPRKPLKHFQPKQTVSVKVIGTHDARTHSFLPITHRKSYKSPPIFELSMKTQSIHGVREKITTLHDLKEGEEVTGFVNNHAPDGVWVSVSPVCRGFVKTLNLTDKVTLLQDIRTNFPLGSAIKCKVVRVDLEKNRLDLTGKVGESATISWDTISKGMVIPGRITKLGGSHLTVQINDSISGIVALTDISDDYSTVSLSKFSRNEIVNTCVIDIARESRKLSLSLRPSRVLDSKLPVKDAEIFTIADTKVGDVRRGFVRNIIDKGLFVSLGGNVVGFVRVSDLSDAYIKEWKDAFNIGQLVTGKIVSIDSTLGHVQMSLKESVVSGSTNGLLGFSDLQPGQIVEGHVKAITDFGIFVQIACSNNLSGLCHRTQVSDNPAVDFKSDFSVGDLVKAKILSLDAEKKQISLGLKASYFSKAAEAVSEMEGSDSADENEEIQDNMDLDNVEDVEDFSAGDNEGIKLIDDDCDEIMADANSAVALSTLGFDWNLSTLDDSHLASEASDEDLADKRRHKKKAAIKEDHTNDLTLRGPQTVADFEQAVLGNPQSSALWIQYMAFYLRLSEVDNARRIAETALSKLLDTTEGVLEKENIWLARLNLEMEFGTEETLENVFKQSLQYNDDESIYLKFSKALIDCGKYAKAEEVLTAYLKRHSTKAQPYISLAQLYFSPPAPGSAEPAKARELLERALKAIPKSTESVHITLISKFAQMEFKYGDPERGRTIFENLFVTYPKRSDTVSVWFDLEFIAAATDSQGQARIRKLFERVLDPKTCKFTSRGARALFKKWQIWEQSVGGNPTATQEAALKFVEFRKSLGKA